MSIIVSKDEAKSLAKNLRQAIPDVTGTGKPSLSQALEIVAKTLGYANWDTFSGMAARQAVPDFAPFPLFIEAFATDEWAEAPSWVRVEVTPQFVKTLLDNQALVKQEGRTEIQLDFSPIWDLEAVIPLNEDTLSVTQSEFWLTAYPMNQSFKWQSRMVSLVNLLVAAGVSDGTLEDTSWLRLGNIVFVTYETEMVEFVESIVNDEAVPQSTFALLDRHLEAKRGQSSEK